jgi:hypothetical protein
VRSQEPVSPQNHFDAGRYEDAANAITAQPEPAPDAIYLAGRSYLHLNRPDDARAQFGRLSAGVDPPTPWSLVGDPALALIDANPGLAIEKASQVGLSPISFIQLPARAGTQRGEQWEPTAAAFEKATTIDPASPTRTTTRARYSRPSSSIEWRRTSNIS